MLLPFSLLMFIPFFQNYSVVLGILSGLIWGYIYLLGFRKARQKFGPNKALQTDA